MLSAVRGFYLSHVRLLTAIELCLIVFLSLAFIWGYASVSNPFGYLFGIVFSIGAVILASVILRKDTFRSVGIRFDNIWQSAREAGLAFFIFTAVVVVIAFAKGASFNLDRLKHIPTYLLRGFGQELFCLGYLYLRFYTLFGERRLAAVFSTAAVFGSFHLPDPVLVAVTFGMGSLFAFLFSRYRNIIVIGILHGLVALLLAMALRPVGLFGNIKVGPRTLSEISNVLHAEWKPGEEIRLGSHEIISYNVGEEWKERIHEMPGGYCSLTAEGRGKALRKFLESKDKVFCLITRKDYEELVPPELGAGLFILAKGYILRRRFEFCEILRILTKGEIGSYVVQEIYLISNYPSSSPQV